ncbi:restriction endonuclease subunit S [Virgibacillus sp. DJP39]|uniref:restriction endonuclease subunit S n=1 Tax=Virgibacillus sp. DJP39 TaxID=3409790 RepID=UPI003BB4AE19
MTIFRPQTYIAVDWPVFLKYSACHPKLQEFLNPGNTISFGQDTATLFYQKDPYFTGDKIKILIPKMSKFNELIALYIITCMRKAFANFSWGSSSFNENIINKVSILLPTKDGKVDYELIENYIKSLYKQQVNTLFKEYNFKNSKDKNFKRHK